MSFLLMRRRHPRSTRTDTRFTYTTLCKLPPGREGDRFRNVRITPAIFPTGRIIRGPIMDFLVWETPDDDYSTSTFITVYANQPIEDSWILGILGLEDEPVWNEPDCNYRGPWENALLQDRPTLKW